jgi:hypothetical protein
VGVVSWRQRASCGGLVLGVGRRLFRLRLCGPSLDRRQRPLLLPWTGAQTRRDQKPDAVAAARHGLRGSKIPRSMMQIDWFFLSFRSPAWQHCQCDILFCWHDQFLLRITVGKSFVSACVKTAVDYTNLPPIHHATFAHLSRPFDRKKDCWISKEIDH